MIREADDVRKFKLHLSKPPLLDTSLLFQRTYFRSLGRLFSAFPTGKSRSLAQILASNSGGIECSRRKKDSPSTGRVSRILTIRNVNYLKRKRFDDKGKDGNSV